MTEKKSTIFFTEFSARLIEQAAEFWSIWVLPLQTAHSLVEPDLGAIFSVRFPVLSKRDHKTGQLNKFSLFHKAFPTYKKWLIMKRLSHWLEMKLEKREKRKIIPF